MYSKEELVELLSEEHRKFDVVREAIEAQEDALEVALVFALLQEGRKGIEDSGNIALMMALDTIDRFTRVAIEERAAKMAASEENQR